MADDVAGKDAKNADESAVTSDAEKVESSADKATEAAAEEVADLDADASEKDSTDSKDAEGSKDSKDVDDEDISLEPDEEEQSPKRFRARHWALTAAALVVIAIAAGTAIIGRLYEEQRIEERSSREALAAAQEFAAKPVDAAKLEALKRHVRYDFALGLDNSEAIAATAARYVARTRTPESANRFFEMYARLTPDDIRAVARKYLIERNRTVVTLTGATLTGAGPK